MKKGFTLMELVIVIIILGILSTVGFRQYGLTIEKARSAEARISLGAMRSEAYEFYLRNNNILTGFDDAAAGIGTTGDLLPGPAAANCRASHYFFYDAGSPSGASVAFTATRCITAAPAVPGGKPPAGAAADTVVLTSNVSSGSDAWTGTGVYK